MYTTDCGGTRTLIQSHTSMYMNSHSFDSPVLEFHIEKSNNNNNKNERFIRFYLVVRLFAGLFFFVRSMEVRTNITREKRCIDTKSRHIKTTISYDIECERERTNEWEHLRNKLDECGAVSERETRISYTSKIIWHRIGKKTTTLAAATTATAAAAAYVRWLRLTRCSALFFRCLYIQGQEVYACLFAMKQTQTEMGEFDANWQAWRAIRKQKKICSIRNAHTHKSNNKSFNLVFQTYNPNR